MYDPTYAPNPVHDPGAGWGPTPEPPRRRTGLALVIAGAVALVLLAGGLAVLGPFRAASSTTAAALPSATGAGRPTTVVAPEVPVDAAPTTVDPAATGGEQVAPTTTGGGTSASGSTGGAPAPTPPTPPAPPAPSAPAPVITSFSTPESIDCHNGNHQTFTVSWSTTGADRVTISIDGPGVYKTYGPTGSDSLPFDCSTPHHFLLTAYGPHGTVATRSITLQPRNVVSPPSPGDEDPAEQGATTPDGEDA